VTRGLATEGTTLPRKFGTRTEPNLRVRIPGRLEAAGREPVRQQTKLSAANDSAKEWAKPGIRSRPTVPPESASASLLLAFLDPRVDRALVVKSQHSGMGMFELVRISIDWEAKEQWFSREWMGGIRDQSPPIAGQGDEVESCDCGTLPGQPARKPCLSNPDLPNRRQPRSRGLPSPIAYASLGLGSNLFRLNFSHRLPRRASPLRSTARPGGSSRRLRSSRCEWGPKSRKSAKPFFLPPFLSFSLSV
jgi:hypothetical protein